jgi:hypothetical protein
MAPWRALRTDWLIALRNEAEKLTVGNAALVTLSVIFAGTVLAACSRKSLASRAYWSKMATVFAGYRMLCPEQDGRRRIRHSSGVYPMDTWPLLYSDINSKY